jgi:hypothetical protein
MERVAMPRLFAADQTAAAGRASGRSGEAQQSPGQPDVEGSAQDREMSITDLLHPLSGSGYQFWSGIGSDIGEVVIIGGLYGLLRKHNCHAKGCWRIGRHPVDGTNYIVCRRHHPDDKPTAEQIVREHEESR